MDSHDLPIRAATPDDWDAISRLMFTVFNDPYDEDEDRVNRAVFEPDRSLVVVDGDQIVGHAGNFARELAIPGGDLPVAHVTMVGVSPSYRRRGLLRRMMRRQLREVYDTRREPLAALWASESRIYQRYGYGLGSEKLSLELSTRELTLGGPAGGTLRTGDPATVQTELAKVYDQVRLDRPGWSSRDDRWWSYLLADFAGRRHGATERRAVLHEGQSDVDGYALWRVKSNWDSSGPKGEVQVSEVVAANPTAYAEIWRFLAAIDLTRTVRYWFASTDEPVLFLADEVRSLGARLADGLWIRVVDVGAALSARRYAAPVDVVIEVTDELLPENAGRWRLTVDGSGAGECTRTDAGADLACDVSVLGAVYLGGPTLTGLAAAGRVEQRRPGALAATSTTFGWHRAPSAIEVF